jgi:DNA-binding MarR family transcriptional regulator
LLLTFVLVCGNLLAEHLLIDKSNASRTVKKLVQLGLVTVTKASADNRQRIFSLTRKGEQALLLLLDKARKRGYKKCYLETLDRMWRANELYKKNGFELLDKPRGKTGHCSCDRWYSLNL